jgi:hypothetical protein
MLVNSARKAFFNKQVAGIAIVMLAIFFSASSFTRDPDRDLWVKQVNVMIRQIGHRLLLQSGDSTSRVLPVTEVKEGIFQLRFENELSFNHDSLILLSQTWIPKQQFPSGYTVTVHEGSKAYVVYSFQVNKTSPDILPCIGRRQPPGKYSIEIAFPDLHLKLKEFKTPTFQSESPITFLPNQSYSLANLVFSCMLVLLGVGLLFGRVGKISKPASANTEEHSIIKPAPVLTTVGKFLLDVKDQRLLLGDEVISLTDKECRILELLNKNFGELTARETLMQKIWINEGVITGRSLDMFVSKLRKKLSSDPELRITNVHGRGYKLETF